MLNKKKYLKPKIKRGVLKIGIKFNQDWTADLLLAQCPGPPTCTECSMSCFLPGTKIFTPEEEKNIENLKIGDFVFSYNFAQKRLVVNKIKKIIIGKEKEYLIINNKIRVTPYHRFWIDKNYWCQANKLKFSDKLFSINGKWVELVSIKRIKKIVKVYNLHLASNHKNFFAEKVLVHNIKCL